MKDKVYLTSVILAGAGFHLLSHGHEHEPAFVIPSGFGIGISVGLLIAYFITPERYRLKLARSLFASNKPKLINFWSWLVLVLACFIPFIDDLNPSLVLFSNDGPLGVMASESYSTRYPGSPYWNDLHWLGSNGGVTPISPTTVITFLLAQKNETLFLVVLSILLLTRLFKLAPSNETKP